MGLENLYGKTEKRMKVSLENLSSTAKEESFIPTAEWLKEFGKRTTTSMFLV